MNAYFLKFVISFLSTLIFSLLISCNAEQKSANFKTTSANQNIKKKAVEISNYDSLFQIIVGLQGNVSLQPDNRTAMEKLLKEAYNIDKKVFYCVGKAVANPKFPSAVQQQIVTRAAQITASRWALFLSMWQRGNFISLKDNLSGELSPSILPLFEKFDNDTFYQLISVPSNND